jgi:hypothetical protein
VFSREECGECRVDASKCLEKCYRGRGHHKNVKIAFNLFGLSAAAVGPHLVQVHQAGTRRRSDEKSRSVRVKKNNAETRVALNLETETHVYFYNQTTLAFTHEIRQENKPNKQKTPN